MRFRASRNRLDCIFTLSKWVVLLVCLSSLMPSGIIAQTESETFESAYGLNVHESVENHNTEENELSPPHAKEAETSSEIEDLAVEDKNLGPVEKKDGEENPTQVLPETENAFVAKSESETDSISVQKVFDGITEEKNGKYVRYDSDSPEADRYAPRPDDNPPFYKITDTRLRDIRSKFMYWYFDKGGDNDMGDYQSALQATSADTSYADTSCLRHTTSSISPRPSPQMVY